MDIANKNDILLLKWSHRNDDTIQDRSSNQIVKFDLTFDGYINIF